MKRVMWIIAAIFVGFASATPAFAHPLDVAYLDFGTDQTGSLTLTVAVHPYQAFELVRDKNAERFNLQQLQKNGDLISAYIQENVSVSRGQVPCTWDAGTAETPNSELEAVADGVLVQGRLSCPSDAMDVTATSTLFLAGFPTQTAVMRLDLPDGFAERATMDRTALSKTINISELFSSQAQAAATSTTMKPHRPDAAQVSIAEQFLQPGLGFWATLGILLAAIAIGALHALGPGHGKSLLAAMLVGERATFRHLLALGTVMTVTHVSDVFLMTLLAGVISSVLPPTQLLNFLEGLSAAGLVGFGLYNFIRSLIRYRMVRKNPTFGDSENAHQRAHELGMPHSHGAAEEKTHTHEVIEPGTFKRALWTGFIGSLAPCPTAWAIFLGTVSVGRVGAGVILLVAFTIGLYATIMLIGMLLLRSKSFAMRHTPPQFTYALPVISAAIITGLGALFFIRFL